MFPLVLLAIVAEKAENLFIIFIYVENPVPESITFREESYVTILMLSVGLNVLGFLMPVIFMSSITVFGCVGSVNVIVMMFPAFEHV